MYKDILVNEILPSASSIRYSVNRAPPSSILRYGNVSPTPMRSIRDSPLKIFSPSSLALSSQRALLSTKKAERFISRTPYKVLDAPELQDDFYLNLVDWSSTNFLGVGLGSCVYLWSANNSKVIKLCDLGSSDSITSVNWIQRVLLD